MPKSSANATDGVTENSPAGIGAPLFFEQPVPVEWKRHAKAGVLPSQDYSFAATVNSLLINGIEFAEAAKHYPIIFTQGQQPLPAVILGLEKQNYFIDSKGKWQDGTYIPAYVRKYPFVFMELAERKEFLLCIDESAAAFKKNGGKGTLPLFDGEKASPHALHALEFCAAFHNHHLNTRQFCNAISEAGLLSPSQSNAQLVNGRSIRLGGFQVIDEKKLLELPENKIVEFHKKGWLALIYFCLQSTSNWKKIVDMAAGKEAN